MSSIVGKPIVIDKLDPQAAAKVVKALIDDNERVQREKEEKKKRRTRDR